MKLPVPLAGLVAGTLVLGGVAVAGAALVTDDGTPLPAAAVASSSADDDSTSSTSSTAPGTVDVSGPCDEAEHAGDPRCAGSPVADDGDGDGTEGGTDDGAGGIPAPVTPAGELRSFAAADAGVVSYTVDGAGFRLVAATPADGWAVEVEQAAGHELDLDFRRGTVRVQVDVEREDGQVRERVRVRDDATDDRSESEVFVGAPAPTTPTTVDDDDRSGPSGDSDDDDDRSGPSGDDSDDLSDDDDRSGPSDDDDDEGDDDRVDDDPDDDDPDDD